MFLPLITLLFGSPLPQTAPAVSAAPPAAALDSDADGLSDQLEQQLLQQFAPTLHIARQDCSNQPARFEADSATPRIAAEDGTLYGQVFPAKTSTAAHPEVEVHFYHLWRADCGAHSHPLDTEHVAVLLENDDPGAASPTWKALYWYAAAHENTVCDVSQIARATTLKATEHGAEVWISPGKHASYLDPRLCERGCGADRCDAMRTLHSAGTINLGEPAHPMNGALFLRSTAWPLEAKMSSSNFPAAPLARLNALPPSEIAWFHAGRHPAQGVIGISSSTEGALAHSGEATSDALRGSGSSTVDAISVSGDHTGNALGLSYRKTVHALGSSARHVEHALGAKDAKPAEDGAPPTH